MVGQTKESTMKMITKGTKVSAKRLHGFHQDGSDSYAYLRSGSAVQLVVKTRRGWIVTAEYDYSN
jgi:hypothetical protein